MYKELFQLCNYKPEEIEREKSRIGRAFSMAGITEEDIKVAPARLRKYHEVELLSVRQVLGCYMREFIDMVLAKEEGKKVLNFGWPGDTRFSLIPSLASKSVHALAPEVYLCVIMGHMFNKLGPILEAAEENGLPPATAMCAGNQLRLGAIVKGICPVPDVILSNAFFCEQTAKSDELMGELFNVPVVAVDGVIDAAWGEFPKINLRRVDYTRKEIERGFKELSELLKIEITPEVVHRARVEGAKLWINMQPIWQMLSKEPQPISMADIGLFMWMMFLPGIRSITEEQEAIATLIKEVKERTDKGIGVVPKGSPRIVWLAPSEADPSIAQMIEGMGLSLVAASFFTTTPSELVPSEYPQDDKGNYTYYCQYGKMCESHYRWGQPEGSWGQLYKMQEVIDMFKPDGVILYHNFSCRTSSSHINRMFKKYLEDKFHIPVLAIEGDWLDPREYGVEAYRTRIETFAYMVRAAKMSKQILH